HCRIITVPRPSLVVAQGLQQIFLALVADAWDVVLPGKIWAMADIAVVLPDEGAATVEPGWVPQVGGRPRSRKHSERSGDRLQVIVAQPFGHVVHRIGDIHFFAE